MTRGRRPHDETGIALPVAVIVLAMVLLLTSVALSSATRSSRGTNKDLEVKLALQAANSGLDLARDRLNPSKLTAPLTASAPCVALQAPAGSATRKGAPGAADGSVAGWCPKQDDRYDNGATSSYRISAGLSGGRTVVSRGTYGTTTRKVATTVGTQTTAQSLFGTYAVSSYDSMQITNNNVITGDVRTNGDVDMNSNGQIKGSLAVAGALRMENNSKICTPGNVTYAATAPYVNPYSAASICGTRSPSATTFTYPDIPASSIPTVATSNNARLCPINGTGGSDPCTGDVYARGIDANRILTIGSNATVTLAGSDKPYLLCGITTYGNGRLIIPAASNVTVFIDTPENCPSGSPRGGMALTNDFQIDNQNCTGTSRPSDSLEFYVLGSASIATRVQWDSNSTGCATIFAPRSTVDFTNNSTFYGAVAGKDVNTSANGAIVTTTGAQSVSVPTAGGIRASTFRECVTSTGTAPDAGCAIG